MQSTDEGTALVIRLNRLTSKGELEWSVNDAPRDFTIGTDTVIPLFLTARFRGKNFALFQKRYQEYNGELEQFYWAEKVVLAILDFQGTTAIWETSEPWSALADLFETARREVANIDGILQSLLDAGEEEL